MRSHELCDDAVKDIDHNGEEEAWCIRMHGVIGMQAAASSCDKVVDYVAGEVS
jgi:hypothetical protein